MFRTSSIIGLLLGLFLLATSASLAAPAAGPAPADTSAPLKSTVSGAEMLEQGREYRAQIESTALQIQTQVLQAKNDKDVIRLNCLIDKQTQVKINGNIMDQALQSLEETVSRHDEGAQLHEYTRITIVNQKVQVLRTEADACVGAETNYVGRTKIVVEAPPGIQNNPDQPTPSEPPVSVVDRPPPASPFE